VDRIRRSIINDHVDYEKVLYSEFAIAVQRRNLAIVPDVRETTNAYRSGRYSGLFTS